MLRTQITLFTISVAIAGCKSTTAATPVLQPVPTASSNKTPDRPVGPWILAPNRDPHTYHSISQTRINELSNSTARQSMTEIATTFTLSLDQSHLPLSISGHIDTVKFHFQDQPSPRNQEFSLPLLFEGQSTASGLTIKVMNFQPVSESCNGAISSIIADLRAVITTYPLRLARGFTWTDSISVTTCTTHGIPTTRKTIQSFKVLGERTFNTKRTVLLQRLDSFYVSGDGAQDNHQVHLEGIGTGTANIYISPVTTVILGVDLFEKLDLTVTNSGKKHHFTQEVNQKLETTN